MKIEVINTNNREQCFRFEMKNAGESISIMHGRLRYDQTIKGVDTWVELRTLAESSISTFEDQVLIFLRALDFDTFRTALKENGVEVTDTHGED